MFVIDVEWGHSTKTQTRIDDDRINTEMHRDQLQYQTIKFDLLTFDRMRISLSWPLIFHITSTKQYTAHHRVVAAQGDLFEDDMSRILNWLFQNVYV